MHNKITDLIDKLPVMADDKRDYIGASSIGHDCWRKIWYEVKGYNQQTINPRLARIFESGRFFEQLILNWVEQCPQIEILQRQFKVESVLPFFYGNADAVILFGKKQYILEIKTANDANFNQFGKKGVKLSHKPYYGQLQAYMGMSGIHQAIILFYNKDSSQLADEIVQFDEVFYNQLLVKAKAIYESPSKPPRINGSPSWYQCKMCRFNGICFDENP